MLWGYLPKSANDLGLSGSEVGFLEDLVETDCLTILVLLHLVLFLVLSVNFYYFLY